MLKHIFMNIIFMIMEVILKFAKKEYSMILQNKHFNYQILLRDIKKKVYKVYVILQINFQNP